MKTNFIYKEALTGLSLPAAFFTKHGKVFGVRFVPGGYRCIFNNGSYEKPFNTQGTTHFIHMIRCMSSFSERIESIFDFISCASPEIYKRHPILNCIIPYIIKNHGMVTYSDLCDLSGYSERCIRNVFSRYAQIPLRQFTESMRFQFFLTLLMSKHCDTDNIIDMCGYYDRSHFEKDCIRLTGMSSSQIRKYLITLK